MIIYSDRKRRIRPLQQIAEPRGLTGDSTRLLLELGELETGLLDAGWVDEAGALDRAVRGAAHLYLGRPSPCSIPLELDEIARHVLPREVEVSTAEGFAYYALHPSAYAKAAAEFAAQHDASRIQVIGLRTIGGTLSAVVAAELEHRGWTVNRVTVRPCGNPFDRRVRLPAVDAAGWHAVVDEGPGLSGSSFGAAVSELLAAGVEASKIVLFPSWNPDPGQLNNQQARQLWSATRRYVADGGAVPGGQEISGGHWRRQLLSNSAWPAVQPQHERRKFLDLEARAISRFCGLGGYGERALRAASILAEQRFGPPVKGCRDGYLRLEFMEGAQVTEASPEFLQHVARYLAARGELPVTDHAPAGESLLEMIAVNCEKAGLAAPQLQLPPEAPAVQVDGRLLPHEWLSTPNGYVKTDAIDHAADHFLPGGPVDIAWDLAGAEVEFRLNRDARDYLLARYQREKPDTGLAERLPFFRIAYLAFRMGYAAMAAETLNGSIDARRFRTMYGSYRKRLKAALAEAAG
jgi:hypothetical protein